MIWEELLRRYLTDEDEWPLHVMLTTGDNSPAERPITSSNYAAWEGITVTHVEFFDIDGELANLDAEIRQRLMEAMRTVEDGDILIGAERDRYSTSYIDDALDTDGYHGTIESERPHP